MLSIIPAILTNKKEILKQRIQLIKDYTDVIHIDVEDGRYGSNKTLSLEYIKECLDEIHYEGKIELHLMVKEPEYYLAELKRISNVFSVILHFDSTPHIYKALSEYKDMDLSVGLSFKLNEEKKELDLLPDFFLVLSVTLGFSGEIFDVRYLSQIERLKNWFPQIPIQVDGGINNVTASMCAKKGVNTLIANSYIFNSQNPSDSLELLRNID